MAERVPEEKIRRVAEEFDPEVIGISLRNVDDQDMAAPRFLMDQAREGVVAPGDDLFFPRFYMTRICMNG